MPDAILHLSSIAGSPLVDSDGHKLGRVEDVIVRLDDPNALPPVTGLRARIGGRHMFVPIERIARLEPDAARTSTTKLNLGQFERREGEVLLRHDLLGRSLINVQTAQLVTAREVELVCRDGSWRVGGVDSSLGAGVRRHMPRRFRDHDGEQREFVAWPDLEPFLGHVPTSRLRLAPRRLARLHPAQIADLVEAASHEEGEEIMEAVGQDKELEADVFEELDEEHQLEFLRERSDTEVAAVLARMASDDAADLLLEIDQDRRLPVLELMPAAKQRKIRDLLGYNPGTAGGLMNPDFLALPDTLSVEEALRAVRSSQLSAPELQTVHVVMGTDGTFAGSLALAEITRAEESHTLGQLIDEPAPVVTADADLPEIARLMTDYNLVALAVVDSDGRMVGVLAVDDILELMLPSDWRRRYGLAKER
jgi:CBS domain-containing protein